MVKRISHSHHSATELAKAPATPATRADCPTRSADHPCPHLRCRHHLGIQPDTTACALDYAEGGPLSLDAIAEIMGGLTRERVRQIEAQALKRIQDNFPLFAEAYLEGREIRRPDLRHKHRTYRGKHTSTGTLPLTHTETSRAIARARAVHRAWGERNTQDVPRDQWANILTHLERQQGAKR